MFDVRSANRVINQMETGGANLQFRLSSVAMLSFFVVGLLLVGTCSAGTPTATATINSISASAIGGPLGTVTLRDSAEGLVITRKL
jgi:hypothetical protein